MVRHECSGSASSGWWPLGAVVVTTLAAIAISVYSLLSGWVIVFQNILYVPMVIACMYYVRRGLVFSITLSLAYLFLVILLVQDQATILHASIRVLMFVGIAGVVTFLSARRRQVEEQLRQHHENLERLVATRTDELKEMADKAMRRQEELLHVSRVNMLGEMATGIAHELNQPLSAIGNYGDACLGLLQAETHDVSRIMQNLEQIVSQSERAGAIIRRMRALVKKKPLELAPVNLNEIIGSILPLVQAEMGDKGVDVTLELTEPLPAVRADAVQMEQVMLNLIRNGIDAMDGEETVPRLLTIRTSVTVAGRVRVDIVDTGVGLPAGEPDRVFEPFFTTKAHGLGLGLPISQSIVEMHRGSLEAVRNPDGGSTFRVTLPAHPEPVGDRAPGVLG
jgi:C4-dicarboxylate-specific signal transduction histidine kinase